MSIRHPRSPGNALCVLPKLALESPSSAMKYGVPDCSLTRGRDSEPQHEGHNWRHPGRRHRGIPSSWVAAASICCTGDGDVNIAMFFVIGIWVCWINGDSHENVRVSFLAAA